MIRADLPPGVQIAQTIHAAGESSPGNLPSGTRAVALAAASEEELLRLEARLVAADLPHVAIREPDPPYHGALMAIGIQPMPRAFLRKLLSSFALVR